MPKALPALSITRDPESPLPVRMSVNECITSIWQAAYWSVERRATLCGQTENQEEQVQTQSREIRPTPFAPRCEPTLARRYIIRERIDLNLFASPDIEAVRGIHIDFAGCLCCASIIPPHLRADSEDTQYTQSHSPAVGL